MKFENKFNIIYTLTVFLVSSLGYGLCWYWFGWKMALVILLIVGAERMDK